MSDPRGGMDRDRHIQESGSRKTGSTAGTSTDTPSATSHSEATLREAMQQELIDLGRWLTEHPEAKKKNLKPVRGSVVLEPGVYHNSGTGMIERIYAPQHIALGARWFRIAKDPAAPVEEIRRRVLEGK
ncbi:MAG: hypothetical protein M3305_03220 [Actinomycetota bacterium]|nr:hypothetical protein [Actinomycetota bacterium]